MSGVSGERKSAAAAVRGPVADEDEDESDEVGEAHGSPAREAAAEVAADAAAAAAEAEAAVDLYFCALTADVCDMATRFDECALAAEAALALPLTSVAASALPLPAVASAEAVSSACV